MARIRSIKPEFWTSEQVFRLSIPARLLFIGMWNFCDDAGRHKASILSLKAEVFPVDDITIGAIGDLVLELREQGLLEEYEVDGHQIWQVTGWKHQRIDKPQPERYPPKPDTFQERSGNGRGALPPDGYDRKEGSDRREGSDPIGESCAHTSAREAAAREAAQPRSVDHPKGSGDAVPPPPEFQDLLERDREAHRRKARTHQAALENARESLEE